MYWLVMLLWPDRDHDGISARNDKCPSDAEDRDGFEDWDGCPELDNDADGRGDSIDQCPNVPEDEDGDRDQDGCPEDPLPVELDWDGDHIPNDQDKCPREAEDLRWSDTRALDGCPDPDWDDDGVLNPVDQCPYQAETRNGYHDADGCPDQAPLWKDPALE
jgi:hypothetical protein